MAFDIRYQWFAIVLVLVCTSCRSGLTSPQDSTLPVPVTTSIGGVVVDQNGTPMAGVTVTAHGATTQTNAYGDYIFKDLSVPGGRACVIARKSGYFTAAHAEWPRENGSTVVSLTMQPVTSSGTVATQTGGTVTVAGASVSFPVNAFALSNGVGYTGTVSVGLSYLTPDSAETFATYFSGDAAAQRTDGSIVQLLSYGVVRVQLTGEAGESLELRQGAKATITYPIPTILAASQPPTIPLWYFDETLGLWKEEGQAVREGATYEGAVSHFTDWNLDVPKPMATIEGTVRCSTSRPVEGVWVRAGQRDVISDRNGFFRCQVPAGTSMSVGVNAGRSDGLSSAFVDVGPLVENATQVVDLMMVSCPSLIEGTIVDCDGRPISGSVRVESSHGSKFVSTTNGLFRLAVPGNELLRVRASSFSSQLSQEISVPAIDAGKTFNIGAVKACVLTDSSYTDIMIASPFVTAMSFIGNGATLVVLDRSVVKFYDVKTASLLRTIDIGAGASDIANGVRLMFSADEKVMMVVSPYSHIQLFRTSTAELLCSITKCRDGFLTSDGANVFTRDSSSGAYEMFNATTGQLAATFSVPSGETRLLGSQRGGKQFVYVESPTAIVVWDATTDRMVLRSRHDETHASMEAVSPDGTIAFVEKRFNYTRSGGFELYDLVTGNFLNPGHTSVMYEYLSNPVAFSPDNSMLARVANVKSIGNVVIHRVSDQPDVIRVLEVPSAVDGGYTSLPTFSANSERIAVCYMSNATCIIRVYDL